MPTKERYAKMKVTKRPTQQERGIPVSESDRLSRLSVQKGSERLLATLKVEHPKIVKMLIEKNGEGTGSGSLPG